MPLGPSDDAVVIVVYRPIAHCIAETLGHLGEAALFAQGQNVEEFDVGEAVWPIGQIEAALIGKLQQKSRQELPPAPPARRMPLPTMSARSLPRFSRISLSVIIPPNCGASGKSKRGCGIRSRCRHS